MGLKQDIINKVKGILDDRFETEDVTYVPDISNPKLTFGNKGLNFDATVLYIDMRGSTEVLNKHNNPVVAKIHMAYFHTIVKIANSMGGEVRSFNGDSMLVFFQGTTKQSQSTAVQAAMKMKYMFVSGDGGINELLKKYTSVDFGIGLDYGKILCTKIGVGGNSNNKDLIWIGNAVNRAVVISDKSKSPNFVGISKTIYDNLSDETKYHDQSKENMWTSSSMSYNGQSETYYYTKIGWVVN